MPPLRQSERGPVTATARVVPPYVYEVLWNIAMHGPLTAGEIADDHNRPMPVAEWAKWTPQGAASRLRSAKRLGLVERDGDGFWMLSEAGRTWITNGAQ